MAAIISALDNHTSKQFGENGHVEYGWSNSIQEKILQFSFQTTRINKAYLNGFSNVLSDLLTTLKAKVTMGSLPEREVAKGYLSMLYRMIGHTRDIIDGKGEYALSYMMLYTWYDFYPELAKYALKCFVDLGDKKTHPYGSWKDIKYVCEYCKSCGAGVSHPFIQYAIQLVNEQLAKDMVAEPQDISLAAKWVPREKSSFGWLYEAHACSYFSEFMDTAVTVEKQHKAMLKCKTQYRKLLSTLNKQLDTVQIKQCGFDWSEIDFNKVTSISLAKQKHAFLNIKNDRTVRFPENSDRIVCAEHFRAHIQKATSGSIEMKGKRISMGNFTKQAQELLTNMNPDEMNVDEMNLLNSQWRDNATQNGALGKMIAMVDVSGSMDGEPMEVAIALGIRIAEKSALGKRIMTFSSSPTWVNLEACPDFISMVKVVTHAPWGMNTNFREALQMILDAIIENKMPPEDVQDMVLVILSDMQMDAGDHCDKKALYEYMENVYATAGVRVFGKPYKPPHILFWNLRSSGGFPALSNQSNCSMVSGFSPTLLNLFCDKGLASLQAYTPWSILEKTLENERYTIMRDKLEILIE
jgi:hypothetical protein